MMTISEFENKVIGKISKKFEVKKETTHHYFYKIYYKGKLIANPYCSHGSSGKEIHKGALSNNKRRLHLDTLQQLNNLANCSMSAENYFNLLRGKNVISN